MAALHNKGAIVDWSDDENDDGDRTMTHNDTTTTTTTTHIIFDTMKEKYILLNTKLFFYSLQKDRSNYKKS